MVMLGTPFSFLSLGIGLLILSRKVTFGAKEYNRYAFPPGFVFGSSTSAYQVEGAAFEDGRTASIFDTFAHSGAVGGTGDVAADEYHKYKEDIRLMAETGLDAYRFSISWPRLIPNGRGHVNPKGVEYYNNLINELIRHGIQPHATLMHLDVPQVLENEYGGFRNWRIIEDFTAYADVCFREFGDRIRYWTTVNEANIFVIGGYNSGASPPCRCSYPFGANCTRGNSSTEPYIVGHNVLLAHASTARLYREKYLARQQGLLGFSLYAFHFIPTSNLTEDEYAARRSYDFMFGWFMKPLMYGVYPEVMKKHVGKRLPVFTKKEADMVKGSFDFVGLNYYTVVVTKDNSVALLKEPRDVMADMGAFWTYYNASAAIGAPKGDPYPVTPWGLEGVLDHFKQVYNNPTIYIHENGQVTPSSISVNDSLRIEYLQAHIGSVLDAVRFGSNTKGYFVWSFLDTFELLYGYKRSFGLYYVDFSDPDLRRYPKLSQKWYSGFLKGKQVASNRKKNTDERKEIKLKTAQPASKLATQMI